MSAASRAWRPRLGATVVGPDRTAFAFWAPGCKTVTLEIDTLAPIAMQRRDDGLFEAEAPCGAGARYRFRVRPDLAVADPASRLQDGDVLDASVVVDPAAFTWENTSWRGRPWHETVLYELHPGACGGFARIEKMLPDLAELGITAVELMPVADFPGRHNWGYDGVLPYAPDTAYGTPEDLCRMIDRAHGLGLMVFLDVVYNHFGPDGNYLHAYAEEFFRNDIETPWGAAIDFRKEYVRRFFIDSAIMWLADYRFDGLRFDAVHAIEDHDFLATMAREIRAALPRDGHVHLVLENDDNDAGLLRVGAERDRYDAQWLDDIHHAFHVLLTGESGGYYLDYQNAATCLARCLAEGFAYQGEASPHREGEQRGAPSAHLPPQSFVAFLQNHDQIGNRALGERLTMLADHDALRAATLLLLLAPQIPLLFMGEERGARTPFYYFTDHQDPGLAQAVRDGRRREFAKFPEFATDDARARIPDPNDSATFAASVPDLTSPPDGEAASWLAFYRDLLRLRHAEIVPRIPGATSIDAVVVAARMVRASWRLGDGAVLTIAANFSDAAGACAPGPGRLLATSGASPRAHVVPARTSVAWLATGRDSAREAP